jgi:hypothetical protein
MGAMNQNLDDFCQSLIRDAEQECAENDPGMTDAAAMVLVGDVYALLVCHGETSTAPESHYSTARENDDLSPFIR